VNKTATTTLKDATKAYTRPVLSAYDALIMGVLARFVWRCPSTQFVALYRPHRSSDTPPRAASLTQIAGGYLLEAQLSDGRVVALLPIDDSATMTAHGLTTTGTIAIRRFGKDGEVVETINLKKTAG
jgi:hypothetical protein